MRIIQNISFLLILLVTAASCRKVIDIDLNSADPKYVIEGIITNQQDSCKVLISKTVNFSDDNNVPSVSGATVTVTDEAGTVTTLQETNPGTYRTASFQAQQGKTYKLSVKIEGEEFTASSTMPLLVSYDSLYVTETQLFDGKEKVATVQFKDPPGKGNAYRYVQYLNGKREKTIFVENDELTDGRTINTELLIFDDDDEEDENGEKKNKIRSGDTLRVDMMCIEYPMFTYWFSLLNASTGENQNATPANPVTNIRGGALGYFSAHTYQTKTIKVP
ncbi:DUF4249 domain-containing protein [Foetidibacter luteolus]|uniref:DUF4249 domain-containing protein n=1 Tax=Foetidibacter luteolus TaxID=2608880 RepID=UPI00129AFA61|nr:DUF4249 domain-containing protein [Foetidibacter luteolus]